VAHQFEANKKKPYKQSEPPEGGRLAGFFLLSHLSLVNPYQKHHKTRFVRIMAWEDAINIIG